MRLFPTSFRPASQRPALRLVALVLPFVLGAAACQSTDPAVPAAQETVGAPTRTAGTDSIPTASPFTENGKTLERATFATGCFWCTESDFDKVPGVVATVSGYTGGTTANVTYEQVGTHRTGHVEAVQVTFDPAVISYANLLRAFWRSTDPTDAEGQFCDRGEPYRSEIFVHNAAQRAAAEASKAEVERTKPFPAPIVTPIRTAATFWAAEAYHQNFHVTNQEHYERYREGCRRDARLVQLWGASR